MFITFEGGEGSGKTTQAMRLIDLLRHTGHACRYTREPGGTPIAGAIRALLLHPDESIRVLAGAGLATDEPAESMLPITEALLLSAARAQHVAHIREWLASGEIVVSDRFADATRAYQGAARGLDIPTISTLETIATGGLRPDLTFLLDLPPSVGQQRKGHALSSDRSLEQLSLFDLRSWNRLDRETLDFHKRVRAGYLALAAAEPDRIVVLDATLPSDELAERVWSVVAPRVSAS